MEKWTADKSQLIKGAPASIEKAHKQVMNSGWCSRPREGTHGWSLVMMTGSPDDGTYEFHQFYNIDKGIEFSGLNPK